MLEIERNDLQHRDVDCWVYFKVYLINVVYIGVVTRKYRKATLTEMVPGSENRKHWMILTQCQ